MKVLTVIGPLVVVVLGVGLFPAIGDILTARSNEPNCSSDQTQGLIGKIASQHPERIFATQTGIVALIIGLSQQDGVGTRALAVSTAGRSIAERRDSLVKEICDPLPQGTMQLRCETGLSPQLSENAQYIQLNNEAANLATQAHAATTFSLDTIRMESKDAETGAVYCAANLKATFEDGTAEQPITYTVQLTTDNQLYAQVSGF